MSAEPSCARRAPRCYRRPSAKTAVQRRVRLTAAPFFNAELSHGDHDHLAGLWAQVCINQQQGEAPPTSRPDDPIAGEWNSGSSSPSG